jgi:hypothetical protein
MNRQNQRLSWKTSTRVISGQVPPRTQFISYRYRKYALNSIRVDFQKLLASIGHRVESGRWQQNANEGDRQQSPHTAPQAENSKARCCKLDPVSDTEALLSPCSWPRTPAAPKSHRGTANTFRRNTFGCSLDGRRPASMTSTVSASPTPRTNRCIGPLPPRLRLAQVNLSRRFCTQW